MVTTATKSWGLRGWAVAAALATTTACGAPVNVTIGVGDAGSESAEVAASGRTQQSPTPLPSSDPPTTDNRGRLSSDGFDPTATRDDVSCDRATIGDDDEYFALVNAHFVVDGQLGALCFGESTPDLVAAWDELQAITPPEQLNDLGLFAGFSSPSEIDGRLLGWTENLDGEGATYMMAINIDLVSSDPDELRLTLAHEFSHVFTTQETQLDYSDRPRNECSTYFVIEGCYRDDSLIWTWIEEFWTDGLIDEVDGLDEPFPEDGEERCDANSGFFGSYGASNPEEDFAESFSAFVYGLEPHSAEQQKRMDWMAEHPALAEYRTRAQASDRPPMVNTFEICGP